MTLADLQWSYRDLTFGADTEFHVNRAEGFEGFEVRTSDSDLPRGDGAIRGLDYVAPRTVAFELAVVELTGGDTTYEEYWTQIREAFRPSLDTDYELVFTRPGMAERMIRCRPIQLTRSEDYKRFNAVGFPPVVLRAVDPRIYSTEEHSGNVPVYAAAGGGVDFSVDFSADFGVATTTEFVATNAGTANAYPVFRFFGPATGTVTAVKLTNTTTGQILQVDTTMTTGQILTADMTAAVTGSNQLVVSLDGASRYGSWALPRDAFYLAPGDNSLRFEITGTSTDAICQVIWRDTWTD